MKQDEFGRTVWDRINDAVDSYHAWTSYVVAVTALSAWWWCLPGARVIILGCSLWGTVNLAFGIMGLYAGFGRARLKKVMGGPASEGVELSRWRINLGLGLLTIAAVLSARPAL